MPESPIQTILSAIADTKAIPADSEHLVDGKLVVSSVIHQRLRELATAEIGEVARGPIFGIPVVEIPDDGQPHDIGGDKVAMVSPIDHVSVIVMPANLFELEPKTPQQFFAEFLGPDRPRQPWEQANPSYGAEPEGLF